MMVFEENNHFGILCAKQDNFVWSYFENLQFVSFFYPIRQEINAITLLIVFKFYGNRNRFILKKVFQGKVHPHLARVGEYSVIKR